MGKANIIDVTPENVDKTGFFCLMSRRKCDGYQRKLKWLKARFDEGLRIKMLDPSKGGRGFIEYIPGDYAWRPVEASDYLFIHCLWIVGQSKGKGHAKLLLDECLADAERCGAKGVRGHARGAQQDDVAEERDLPLFAATPLVPHGAAETLTVRRPSFENEMRREES